MVTSLDAEIIDTVDVLGAPTDEDLGRVVDFGKRFAEKVKSLTEIACLDYY